MELHKDLIKTGFYCILVHSGLDALGRHLMRLDDVNFGAPTGNGVAVDGVHQRLADGLEQLIGRHVFEPEGLAHAQELLVGRTSDDEVVRQRLASNEVHGADVALFGLRVQSGHDRLNEERTEASAKVQGASIMYTGFTKNASN